MNDHEEIIRRRAAFLAKHLGDIAEGKVPRRDRANCLAQVHEELKELLKLMGLVVERGRRSSLTNPDRARVLAARKIHCRAQHWEDSPWYCGSCFTQQSEYVPWPCGTAVALGASSAGYPESDGVDEPA